MLTRSTGGRQCPDKIPKAESSMIVSRRLFIGSALCAGGVARMDAASIEAREPWWQSAVGYQVYPASFADSNGDGVGDIPGLISKLDYLAELGIGFIWLSPVYASPMVDNGYDIADFQAINPTFGNLTDIDRLIAEAKQRHIGIVMDLVVNHTSDQHRWFKEARSNAQSPYHDYYIWRNTPPLKGSPADIQASFGGSAWTRDDVSGRYYLHLFAPQQPDLNWANPKMRADIYRMMNWWLDRGIAGFRMDVIDLIGKEVNRGITTAGPRMHDYLQEMNRATLAGRDVVTVGETWSTTPAKAPLYSAPNRHELSMIFQFDQVTRFWDKDLGKWKPKPIDLPALKDSFATWQNALHDRGWGALFWSNHDLPRAVSRYGNDGKDRVASAKMLATVLHLMEGTPYIYQGEEIGMTNAGFTKIDQYRDLETLNFHRIQVASGVSEEDFLAGARTNSRDNARTPMQWSSAPNAGFTTGQPWIEVNSNYKTVNAEQDRADPQGVFARYKLLIALRKRHHLIRHGSFRLLAPDHEQLFAFERKLGNENLVVLANFTNMAIDMPPLPFTQLSGVDLLTNQSFDLAAYHQMPAYASLAILSQM